MKGRIELVSSSFVDKAVALLFRAALLLFPSDTCTLSTLKTANLARHPLLNHLSITLSHINHEPRRPTNYGDEEITGDAGRRCCSSTD